LHKTTKYRLGASSGQLVKQRLTSSPASYQGLYNIEIKKMDLKKDEFFFHSRKN
jgi:hypothetical protein